MLNSTTTKLDQIMTMGQSSKNGLGYIGITNTIATMPKTVFVKASVTNDVATTSKIVFVKNVAKTKNTHGSSKNSTSSLSKGKKKFVPIFHYCSMPGHIRPKCFEYKNTFKMSRIGKYDYKPRFAAYKPKTIPKHKIDLKKNVKKIWIKKKLDLMCYVAYTSLNAFSTNS